MAARYLEAMSRCLLAERIEQAEKLLVACTLCPRLCGVDRLSDERGYCRTGRLAEVASYGPHFGEESVLVGSGGSGAIFFCGCNLLCSFCQEKGKKGTELFLKREVYRYIGPSPFSRIDN